MIKFKINVLNELKKIGYTTYKLKKDNIISGGVITKLQKDDTDLSLKTIDLICKLLKCKVSDIIEYISDDIN